MHFSLFAFGTWGDVRPLVVLGVGLQNAGHDVTIIASRGYETWVRARNLDFYALTDDIHQIINDTPIDVYKPLQGLRAVREKLPQVFTRVGLDVLNATQNSDALLTVEFSLSVLFDVLQVNNLKPILINPAPLSPTRAFAMAFPPLPQWSSFQGAYNHMSHRLLQRLHWWLLAKPRRDLNRRHLGLPIAGFHDFQTLLAATPTLTVVSPHVLPRPADWDEKQHITGYLFDDDPTWTPPPALSDFLAAGDPPVYIGFGSMPDRKAAATTRLFVDALQRTGKRGVVLTGWAGFGAGDVPPEVLLLDYAPHHWLFPRMAAVVHHGGAGTTASTFRAGAPSIIVPHNGDQPYWGRVAQRLGIGTSPIPRGKLNAHRLAAAIDAATSDRAMQARAAQLGQKIAAEDGAGEAVRVIAKVLSM